MLKKRMGRLLGNSAWQYSYVQWRVLRQTLNVEVILQFCVSHTKAQHGLVPLGDHGVARVGADRWCPRSRQQQRVARAFSLYMSGVRYPRYGSKTSPAPVGEGEALKPCRARPFAWRVHGC